MKVSATLTMATAARAARGLAAQGASASGLNGGSAEITYEDKVGETNNVTFTREGTGHPITDDFAGDQFAAITPRGRCDADPVSPRTAATCQRSSGPKRVVGLKLTLTGGSGPDSIGDSTGRDIITAAPPPPSGTRPVGLAILPSGAETVPPIPVLANLKCSTTFIGTLNADLVDGSLAGDRMFGQGGDGVDSLLGLDGRDRLSGGNGNDVLIAGTGRNVILEGAGNDTISARNGKRDVISCGAGRDTIRADGIDVKRNWEVRR